MIDRGHFHAVRFYENQSSLCRIVASFLREGFAHGQPALIIATAEHSRGIVAELSARDLFAEALIDSGDLILIDATQTLASFMLGGLPNPDKFAEVITAALERVRRGRRGVTVRAYGEMVDILWKQGLDVAAIQLEMLWNRLARNGEFSLLCGYAMGNFYKDASVREVCRQHTHLVHSDGTARVSNVDTLLVGALPDRGRT
jgi:KaiC/GvpD/RAD55 family RecA-like ATPase